MRLFDWVRDIIVRAVHSKLDERLSDLQQAAIEIAFVVVACVFAYLAVRQRHTRWPRG